MEGYCIVESSGHIRGNKGLNMRGSQWKLRKKGQFETLKEKSWSGFMINEVLEKRVREVR